jgi:hypothetical protein
VGNAPTVMIAFTFSDRDGNTGDIWMYLPFSTPVETAFAFAYAAVPVLHAVSDARVTRISVNYKHVMDSPDEPLSSANTRSNLLLFYRRDTDFEAINIISPRVDLLETTGDYAGIRLDMSNASVLAFADDFATWAIPLTTSEGHIIGPELVTGGIMA